MKKKILSEPMKARLKSSRKKQRTQKTLSSRKPSPTRPEQIQELGVPVAQVTHYFSKIMVCVLKMAGYLSVGDRVHIKGATTDFKQTIQSLQIESVNVKTVKKGQLVGLKVNQICRAGDIVYKI